MTDGRTDGLFVCLPACLLACLTGIWYCACLDGTRVQLDMITDTFNKLVSSCHSKCISPRYAEGELTAGESNCIDRCVAKFFVVNQKVGEKMQAMGNAAQQNGAFR